MKQETIDGFRLSPQQRRLWLLQEDSIAYRAQWAVSIEGNLQPGVLREALQQIVSRHEILRTNFKRLHEMKTAMQVVSEAGTLAWHERDLSGHTGVEEFFLEEAERRFNLEEGPLLRATLARMSPEQHVLIASLPSLCADARTVNNLVEELAARYASSVTDEEPDEDVLQYIQFSEWQNQLLEEDDAEAGKQYWRKQGLEKIPELRLPYDTNEEKQGRFTPEVYSLEIGSALSASLMSTAGRYGAGIAELLLACWQTLLWRLTGESEIAIGTVSDDREHEKLDKALGLFAKSLPIRCRFSEGSKLEDILSQNSRSIRDASEWQDYFLFERNDEFDKEGRSTHFFQLGFESGQRNASHKADGVAFSIFKQFVCTERFDLKLSCVRVDDSLVAEFYYDRERFQSSYVRRLASQFQTLLQNVVENPGARLGEIEILSDAELNQLLTEFNETRTEFRNASCIHQLFEEQVERTPNRLAAVFENRKLTYRELNSQANQLARHLEGLGVGPESIVGLYLHRSLEMLVGVFGILKAGAGYLPLDVTHPPERLALMLQETNAPVLLTEAQLAATLPEISAQTVCLDGDWNAIEQQRAQNTATRVSPDNLAYVIYTSGSTGKPKGVMIQHRSAVNLAAALGKAIGANHGRALRVSVNAPLIFDASVKQLLQILQGHTLYVLPEEVRASGDELFGYVTKHSLNLLDCTPSQLKLLLSAESLERGDHSLETVLVGGEPIDQNTWSIIARNDRTAFYNVYGPTECTVDATVSRVSATTAPVIGRPLANAQTYILDKNLKPVPVGVAGELCIGGEGLARGYLNSPDITAEKFIPNPFSKQAGLRLYRTGDQACFLPDGSIKFIGRLDHQVKLRGYRIELGEIEAVLRQHESIKDSVVTVSEDEGENRLVGYLVSEPGVELRIEDVKQWARGKLPEYMVPAWYVEMERLPLTRNGKVDRRALPPPQRTRLHLGASYVAPRNKIEQKITDIWQELLRIEKVGINDNFFDLGGHSLLMVQLHSKLRDTFDNEISIVEVFKHPTISLLARYISGENSPSPLHEIYDRADRRKGAMSERLRKRKKVNE